MAGANTPSSAAARKHPAHWDGLLSERSKLFYDGTYTWDGSDGFWDDTGSESPGIEAIRVREAALMLTLILPVHHVFNDPDDPESAPPTPRPVGRWFDEDEEAPVDEGRSDDMHVPANGDHALLRDRAQAPTNSVHLGFLTRFTREGSKAILSNDDVRKQTLLRDDLFVDYPDRERLLGQIEGMVIGQHVLVDGQTLVDSYKLCGLEIPSALLDEVNGYAVDEASGGEAEARASSTTGGETAGAMSNEPDQLDVLSEDVQMSPKDRRAGTLDVGEQMKRMLT
jgi:hypothetical protein